MKDNVLNKFTEELLNENVESEKFEQYIDMFSKFLGYINPDYKYNGTYLNQYINDFMQVYQMIRRRNCKYHEIVKGLKGIGLSFELIIDQVFFGKFSLKSISECYYIGIQKERIIEKSIEIRVEFETDKSEHIFCKEYEDFEANKLVEEIRYDIKKFASMKKIRRGNNETA